MIKMEFSAKALWFIIAAIELQLEQSKLQRLASTSVDEISDLSNDAALLEAVLSDMKRKRREWDETAPPPGDLRARMKLKNIMQCLRCEGFTEAEQDALIAMGRDASPDPAWTDYLYWPSRFGLEGSIDAALDKAFSYRAIRL